MPVSEKIVRWTFTFSANYCIIKFNVYRAVVGRSLEKFISSGAGFTERISDQYVKDACKAESWLAHDILERYINFNNYLCNGIKKCT